MNYEDEGQKCLAKFEARRAAAEEAIAALPPLARWLFERWRPEIERAGRMRTGCCCGALIQFAEDLRQMLEPATEASEGKTLIIREGSGF